MKTKERVVARLTEKVIDYTPQDMKGNRLKMSITTKDWERHRETELTNDGYEWIPITDLITGKKYLTRRISCGLDCFCDAEVKPLR